MSRRAARQAGAALLMAMLTVALVATFATAALWQQWRSIEVESAERARVQSSWILTGALDWARLVLREDMRSGNDSSDHLSEPWAVPLQEARLSSFLAADKNNTSTDTTEDILDAFLSGQVIDAQSLMNVRNLASTDGKVQQSEIDAFARLFDLLQIDRAELEKLVENFRFALDTSTANQSGALAPLAPNKIEELVWLGLSPATVSKLQPYITILPIRTAVNVNTASAEVIYASAPQLSMADAQNLVSLRERSPFKSIPDIVKAVGRGPDVIPTDPLALDVRTAFFEVRARLRLDKLVVEERSLIHRLSASEIVVLWRERGIADPTALAQAPVRR
ncbi:general secretion pathway protein GspK [Caenimonas koreensis DSM 17982]|uniref:Type II secretion system protein K n=1 Tax=Caenimonas koreensis DSM 17982 TaxID=1121255 RepID=A0A844B2D7_9BURK|nr:type II secretion system minor pseudopilin GspK [Caenimonas koreensis]MRD48898.1 general secretion pathway protein GspK [Caenimonas koreensis DSM 17982]